MRQFTAECFEVTVADGQLTFRYRWGAVGLAVLVLGLATVYFGFPVVECLRTGEVNPDYLAGFVAVALLPAGMVACIGYILSRWRVPPRRCHADFAFEYTSP